MKNGFIIKDGEDYGLTMGNGVYFLRDGIEDIKEDVEIGINKSQILDGYCLGINKIKKIWFIKDTGHKNCKDIIVSGKYKGNFEKSLEPFFKIFK